MSIGLLSARKLTNRYPWALAAIMLLLPVGCATPTRPDALYNHVIQFDPDGYTLDPRTGQRLTTAQTRQQFADILAAMTQYLDDKPVRKVLIHVHGGLVTPDDALNAATADLAAISKADPNYYPVFVVWNSSLDDTYREHLFDVRQGQKTAQTEAWGRIDFPLYFLSDFLVAISRAPTVWLQQRATDDDAVEAALKSMESNQRSEAWMEARNNVNAMTFFLELNRRYYDDRHSGGQTPRQMAISIEPDYSQPSDWIGRGVAYTLTIPTKLLTAPLIDALGTAAWRDMTRRTLTVVDGSADFQVNRDTTPQEIDSYVNRGTDGGLDHFIAELAEKSHSPSVHGATTRPWQVTLVGHSMGTMIINEILRRQIQRETNAGDNAQPLPVQQIVYMGAACSIRDFTQGVIPFMQLPDHAAVQFYNLSLHPTAELIDAEYDDIPPRGSLLCWIDDFLGSPQTPLDRTLGRWVNLVDVPYVIPPDLRGRVGIKAFALERPNTPPNPWEPQKHGDFSSSPFWDQNFWTPGEPLAPDRPRARLIKAKQQEQQQQAPQPVSAQDHSN